MTIPELHQIMQALMSAEDVKTRKLIPREKIEIIIDDLKEKIRNHALGILKQRTI